MLHDGVLRGLERKLFRIDGSALPSGNYLYRATGETFVESRRVVLVQ